jgi:oxalate decarboxylase
VLAENFGVKVDDFDSIPSHELYYMFQSTVPGAFSSDQVSAAVGPVGQTFSHRLLAQEPIVTKGGRVHIADSTNFPAATTIAAALVELELGAMRELHWHPNTDEWQYYIEGTGRMTVFASAGVARTFDYHADDLDFPDR